jgi:hypothetical protein
MLDRDPEKFLSTLSAALHKRLERDAFIKPQWMFFSASKGSEGECRNGWMTGSEGQKSIPFSGFSYSVWKLYSIGLNLLIISAG